MTTRQTLGRDLAAAVAGVTRRREAKKAEKAKADCEKRRQGIEQRMRESSV